jgi:hypothetical protein
MKMNWQDKTHKYFRVKVASSSKEWQTIKDEYIKQGWKFCGIDHTEHAIFSRPLNT